MREVVHVAKYTKTQKRNLVIAIMKKSERLYQAHRYDAKPAFTLKDMADIDKICQRALNRMK